jgi:hypothetical protein
MNGYVSFFASFLPENNFDGTSGGAIAGDIVS